MTKIPKRLKQNLNEHEIYTASERGWIGISTLRNLIPKIKEVLKTTLKPGPTEVKG